MQESASLAVEFVVAVARKQTPIGVPLFKDTCPLLRDTKREFPRSSMIGGGCSAQAENLRPAKRSLPPYFGGGAGKGRGFLVGFGPDGLGPPFFWATAMLSRPVMAMIETTADKVFHSFIGFLLLGYRDSFSPHSERAETIRACLR